LADKLSYIEQICAGLHYAHLAGIVHRDVKPANIMVDRQGVVRILDFGIARIEGSAMTLDGTMVGSLNYMSPEQMLGKTVDHRSDMFSLGSVAYELLCYQQAFKGSMNDGLLQRLPHEDSPPLTTIRKDLPPELELVIAKALKKLPDDRYPDLEVMRAALLEVKRGLGQDDVRTIVVRPVGRALSNAASPARPERSAKPSALWGDAQTDAPEASAPRPAWATPVPTRLALTPQPIEAPVTPTPSAAKPSTTTTTKRSSTTTRTRVAPAYIPPPPAERTSVVKGVVVGSMLGIGLIGVLSAMSWRATPPPTPLERERPAIGLALEQFRAAYRTRDMEAMTVVFPSMPSPIEQAMRRTFNTCLVYEVKYDGVRVRMDENDDTLATADIRSSHTCTPKSGGRETTTDKHDILSLRKIGEAWLVEKAAPIPIAGLREAR
jgi:serine/threonine protein kinase